MSDYLIFGQRASPDDPDFPEKLAAAHARRHRPLCLCTASGHEMYVARLENDFVVKRMPFTGSMHAPHCPSYDPPPEISGLRTLGSAVREDPDSGLTLLRLDFPISKAGTRTIEAVSEQASDSVLSEGNRLTLRGLLQYLWDEAELTRWRPEFAGKRSWSTVRKHLLQAAAGKIVRGRRLTDILYVPEVFSVDKRGEINARRVGQWMRAALPGPGHLLIAIGELKELAPARFGFKAVLKHVPDQAFLLDEKLYRRMERRFERELSLWGASEAIRMLLIATFVPRAGSVPEIHALSLLPVNPQWLPVENVLVAQLVNRLVQEGRRFKKITHGDCGADAPQVTAVLVDTDVPCALYIGTPETHCAPKHYSRLLEAENLVFWTWDVDQAPPPLPPPIQRREQDNSAGVLCG